MSETTAPLTQKEGETDTERSGAAALGVLVTARAATLISSAVKSLVPMKLSKTIKERREQTPR